MNPTHENAELVTRGWAPGAAAAVYYAVDQEARRALGEPPDSALGGARPPLVEGTADDSGVLTVTVESNTPLLAYGPRADPRDSRWVQTMAHPAWQVPETYISG
jgi:hypothetical protein